MTTLELEKTDLRPGEELKGTASWDLQDAPPFVEIRLFWSTQGKGTVDKGLIDSLRFEGVSSKEQRAFTFTLPAGPYSFSGRLISLLWAVELGAGSSKDPASAGFVLSPSGQEIVLSHGEAPPG